MKQQLNLRVSDLTILQLKQLQEWWGTSQTETITLIIDRSYQEERKSTMDAWLQFNSYDDWQTNKWGPRTPVLLSLLEQSGGVIKARAGLSNRAIVEMPDGKYFEEGLSRDGACYEITPERFREFVK